MEDNRHGELFRHENYLIYGDNAGNYYHYEFYDWDEIDDDMKYFTDSDGNGILGYVGTEVAVGYHACRKSKIWNDMEGYVDTIQQERELPDGKYIVCYFYVDDNLDMLSFVDYEITKEQIIANVEAQKYVEGAEYYLMESMRGFIK